MATPNLEALLGFMELAQDPGKYKAILAEAQQVLADIREANGIHRELSSVRKWEREMEAEYTHKLKELDDHSAALVRQEESLNRREKSMSDADARARGEIQIREQELVRRENTVKALEDERLSLAKLRAVIEADREEIKQERAALRAKEVALKSILS